jgi:hypothetical protein
MIDIAHHIISNSSSISDVLGNLANFDISTLDISTLDLSQIDLSLDLKLNTDWIEIAQTEAPKNTQFNQNVVGDMGKGWNNFVKSGQVWALIIGATLGYLFRSVTSS